MRGKAAKLRKVIPDPVYNSELVSKLICMIMQDGKKDTASRLVYSAIESLGKQAKKDPMQVLETAIENVKPKVEVRSRRVGGANYQVPVPVEDRRQLSLALRWIIEATRSTRKKNPFDVELSRTLFQAYNKEGAAYKKREETHKMADANKAFAHFTW